MSLIVQKFGGTSVSNIDRIRKVALIIKQEIDNGNMSVVVVSAMSGVTNNLVSLAKQLGAFEGDEEYDAIVSSGEQITAGLVAQSLKELGIRSRSFTAWQLPIVTDDSFGKANIKSINTYALKEYVKNGGVPVITGFQGVCDGARVTTFGRGGSDMTAVAISAALGAEICDIYTDVSGVFTADPMIVPNAKIINSIDYTDMLEMSYSGAKVLQSRAVEYAINNDVIMRVKSSFINGEGSIIGHFETKSVVGLALSDNLERISVFFDNEDHFNKIVEFFNENMIKFDISVKTDSYMTIFVNKDELHNITESLQYSGLVRKIEYLTRMNNEPQLSKITIIGHKTPELVEQVELALQSVNIKARNISQFRTKVIVWVESCCDKIALNAIHNFCIINGND